MKKYIIPILLVLFIAGIFTYAAMQPSRAEHMRAEKLYKAKIFGDKDTFISLYGASSDATIRLYEKRMKEYRKNQARIENKRAMAEKAYNE